MTPTLLFVHSPAVGPTTWSPTAEVLRGRGFRCSVPDLTGVATAGPPYYSKFARATAEAVEDDDPVVLIGHSAAGPLLPVIADAAGGRTVAAVLVDAFLPHPGRSWFDTAPVPLREQLLDIADAGRLPPWNEWFAANAIEELVPDPSVRRQFIAEIPRLPLAYFLERAPVTPSRDTLQFAYMRFSPAYDRTADDAERLGWWVLRRDWDHLRMLTAPDAVADLVAAAVSALRVQ
jgi:pimeloyl-ACP methyl ester carboxylesterase